MYLSLKLSSTFASKSLHVLSQGLCNFPINPIPASWCVLLLLLLLLIFSSLHPSPSLSPFLFLSLGPSSVSPPQSLFTYPATQMSVTTPMNSDLKQVCFWILLFYLILWFLTSQTFFPSPKNPGPTPALLSYETCLHKTHKKNTDFCLFFLR